MFQNQLYLFLSLLFTTCNAAKPKNSKIAVRGSSNGLTFPFFKPSLNIFFDLSSPSMKTQTCKQKYGLAVWLQVP